MGHELKQKPTQVDDDSSSSDQEEQEELGAGLLLESSENPWMDHVSYINCAFKPATLFLYCVYY